MGGLNLSDVKRIPLSIIRKSPKNPRKILSDIQQEDSKQYQTIEGLAQNIQEIGLINPITVKPSGDEYIIVAGERRFEALKSLNYIDAPCIIIDPNSEQELLIMLSENIQRKDLSAKQKADGIWEYKMFARRTDGKELSTRELSAKLGIKSHVYVHDLLTFHGYPNEVKEMEYDGKVSEKSLRPIRELETDTEKIKTAQYIADNELNHKQAKQVVEVVKNQLTESQRGMIAANMKPLYEKEARERSLQNLKQREELPSVPVDTLEEKGRTSEIVGNMFGVSARTVDRASAVIKNGVEELQEAVKAGKSTFQWIGGLPKVYLFRIYMGYFISKIFVISSGGYQNLSFFVYI